ncbi:MAG: hypothetical protein ACJ71K_19685 [Nitrososphaeraceae archaeon]
MNNLRRGQMKEISQYKGSKKYKLNYIYLNYNDKTGFYKNRRIESSPSSEVYKKQQQNMKHWKCEKCANLFSRFRQLKQHKEEYHAY